MLGLILLSAAALKGHQLATEPVAETGLFTSRWLLICVVEFELFFGLWLLSGLYPRRTWQAALLCFSAFACVSLYKALSGEATCGCFGRVPVNPWYTLVLDLAAVAALGFCRPAGAAATSPLSSPGEGRGVRAFGSPLPPAGEGPGVRAAIRTRPAWLFGLFLAAGIPAGVAMAAYHPATLDDSGGIFGDSDFVVLEPQTWVGRRFPLLRYIDIADQLTKGKWLVVLYRHDCANCEEAIREYEQCPPQTDWRPGPRRIALVEMPPYGETPDRDASTGSGWIWGRLSDGREWFVRTPSVLALDHGQVVAVDAR